jgi:hypothetical protein
VEDIAAVSGIVLGAFGILVSIAASVLQGAQASRQFAILSETLVDHLALNLIRFDRLDVATNKIIERLT